MNEQINPSEWEVVGAGAGQNGNATPSQQPLSPSDWEVVEGGNQPQQQQATSPAQVEQSMTAGQRMMNLVDVWNRGFERYALGTIQGFASIVPQTKEVKDFRQNLQRLGTQGVNKDGDFNILKNTVVGEKQYQQSKEALSDMPVTRRVVGAVSNVGGGLIATLPATLATTPAGSMTVLRAIGQGMATGGMAGLTDWEDNPDTRLLKAGISTTAGGILAGGMQALGNSISNSIGRSTGNKQSGILTRMFKPNKAAEGDLALEATGQVGSNIDDVAKSVAAANRQGVNVTPGQALGPLSRAREMGMKADLETKVLLNQADDVAEAKVKQGLLSTVNKMAPDDAEALKTQLYQKLEKLNVSDDIVANLKQNPIIADELDNLSSSKFSSLRNTPDNSVIKLDKAKDEIDFLIWKNKRTTDPANKFSSEKLNSLLDARGKISNTLSTLYPDDYPAANAVSQQLKIKGNYLRLIEDTATNKAGTQGKQSLDNIYNSLFQSESDKAAFLKDVALTAGKNPEKAVAMAKDWITLSNQLYASTIKRITGRMTSELGTQAADYTSKQGVIANILNKLGGDGYQKAQVELMLSGNKWAPKITNILKMKDVGRQQMKAIQLITDAAKMTTPGVSADASRGFINQYSTGR